MADEEPLLECRGIAVRFGGLLALSNLSMSLKRGEVLGIAGPNGAGKTTLFNVISGHVRPTRGTVLFRGEPITRLSPDRIFQRGIARTFQIPELIATQSTYMNILVGAHFAIDRSPATTFSFGPVSHRAADEAAVRYDLGTLREKLASAASLYERKLIMLASALAHAPEILLLDEPVSGFNASEAEAFLAKINEIRSRGTTIVIIEHVMRVLMALSDRLVILNRGEVLFAGRPEAARDSPEVQRLYLGQVTP